jgi:hypothetical protein
MKYTPQIFRLLDKENEVFEPVGSSVLIRFNERKFLITASHLKYEYENLYFLRDNHFHLLDGKFVYTNPNESNLSKFTDILVCEIDQESNEFLSEHYDFVNAQDINFDYYPKTEKNFLIFGYPWRKTRFNRKKNKFKIIPYKFLTEIYNKTVSNDLTSFKDQLLILDYKQREIINTRTGFKKKSVMLEGLSGCGVWHIPNLLNIDQLRYNLVGILIRQDEFSKRYVISTRIHIISEVLRVYFDVNLKKSRITVLEKNNF